MILRQVHLDFWYAVKGVPAWADRLTTQKKKTPQELIDGCVNAHGIAIYDTLPAQNLCVLVKWARNRGDNLLKYLRFISLNPGTVIRPERRAAYAKKWAKRLSQRTPTVKGETHAIAI